VATCKWEYEAYHRLLTDAGRLGCGMLVTNARSTLCTARAWCGGQGVVIVTMTYKRVKLNSAVSDSSTLNDSLSDFSAIARYGHVLRKNTG